MDQQDIPDFNKQEIPKAVLSAEIQAERDVRRYIKKDGTFNKDFVHFFDIDTGTFDSGGRIIYKPTKTVAEAQAFITKLCEDTGRKVSADAISGRLKAEPGWNLDIRVPGMASSEQKAAMVPEGVLRERLNNQLLIDQKSTINSLAEQVAYLTVSLAEKEQETPELTAAQKKAKAKA